MTNLLSLLYNHLDWHPSRIKCLNEMIFASIRCKTPHHSDMADYLSGNSTQGSKVYTWFKVGLKVITAWVTSKPPHLASFFSCLEGMMKTV